MASMGPQPLGAVSRHLIARAGCRFGADIGPTAIAGKVRYPPEHEVAPLQPAARVRKRRPVTI